MDTGVVDDDASAAAAEEMPDRFARAEERSTQVHRENSVEILDVDLMASRRFLNARVVDQHV